MLSPQVQERIIPPANLFYCDCKFSCTDSFILPVLVGEMLMNDTKLVLIIGKHKPPESAEKVEKKGKGWKVYRVK